MNIITHEIENMKIAELTSSGIIIDNIEDGLNLLGDLYYQGFDSVLIYKENITSDFFDLSSGIAGEILQKFSTYRVRLAIIGDFSTYTSKSLTDFMYESNKNRHINFVYSVTDAINILSK